MRRRAFREGNTKPFLDFYGVDIPPAEPKQRSWIPGDTDDDPDRFQALRAFELKAYKDALAEAAEDEAESLNAAQADREAVNATGAIGESSKTAEANSKSSTAVLSHGAMANIDEGLMAESSASAAVMTSPQKPNFDQVKDTADIGSDNPSDTHSDTIHNDTDDTADTVNTLLYLDDAVGFGDSEDFDDNGSECSSTDQSCIMSLTDHQPFGTSIVDDTPSSTPANSPPPGFLRRLCEPFLAPLSPKVCNVTEEHGEQIKATLSSPRKRQPPAPRKKYIPGRLLVCIGGARDDDGNLLPLTQHREVNIRPDDCDEINARAARSAAEGPSLKDMFGPDMWALEGHPHDPLYHRRNRYGRPKVNDSQPAVYVDPPRVKTNYMCDIAHRPVRDFPVPSIEETAGSAIVRRTSHVQIDTSYVKCRSVVPGPMKDALPVSKNVKRDPILGSDAFRDPRSVHEFHCSPKMALKMSRPIVFGQRAPVKHLYMSGGGFATAGNERHHDDVRRERKQARKVAGLGTSASDTLSPIMIRALSDREPRRQSGSRTQQVATERAKQIILEREALVQEPGRMSPARQAHHNYMMRRNRLGRPSRLGPNHNKEGFSESRRQSTVEPYSPAVGVAKDPNRLLTVRAQYQAYQRAQQENQKTDQQVQQAASTSLKGKQPIRGAVQQGPGLLSQILASSPKPEPIERLVPSLRRNKVPRVTFALPPQPGEVFDDGI